MVSIIGLSALTRCRDFESSTVPRSELLHGLANRFLYSRFYRILYALLAFIVHSSKNICLTIVKVRDMLDTGDGRGVSVDGVHHIRNIRELVDGRGDLSEDDGTRENVFQVHHESCRSGDIGILFDHVGAVVAGLFKRIACRGKV